MTTKILVEFDPKDASPLEVINTLNILMQQNLKEGKISDYSLAQQFEQSDVSVSAIIIVAKSEPMPQETPQP